MAPNQSENDVTDAAVPSSRSHTSPMKRGRGVRLSSPSFTLWSMAGVSGARPTATPSGNATATRRRVSPPSSR